MLKLQTPTEIENKLSKQLQEAIRNKIDNNNWDENVLAEKLELLPSGVTNLLDRKEWPISTTIRVASALNINLIYQIENN